MFKINRLDFLISFYIFCIVAAELLGAKTFHLGSIGNLKLSASVTIFLVAFIFTINDIIIEVYGKERAQSIIRSGLVIIFLLFLFSLFAVWLPPSARFQSIEPAYDEIFTRSARISAASLVAFATSLFLDVSIFAKVRERLGKNSLWLRSNVSNFGAQFFDTLVFMTLAFYALDTSFQENFVFLIGLILPYWILKCLISILDTPFVYLGVNWLRKELPLAKKSTK